MRVRIALVFAILSGAALAQGPSIGTIIEALATAGTEAGIAMLEQFDALDPTTRAMLAPVAVTWITDSRDAAIARGVAKIPTEIRNALADYVPDAILADVRWRVEDDVLSAEHKLFSTGYATALTLDYVILFATADKAADPKLWAHEIFHVMQFHESGIDGMVARYLEDRAAVERDAGEFRWQWMKATNRVPPP
jgi:hypothetical protein